MEYEELLELLGPYYGDSYSGDRLAAIAGHELLLAKVKTLDISCLDEDVVLDFVRAKVLNVDEALFLFNAVKKGGLVTAYGLVEAWLLDQISFELSLEVSPTINPNNEQVCGNWSLSTITACVSYGGPTTYVKVQSSDLVTVSSSNEPPVSTELPIFAQTLREVCQDILDRKMQSALG